MSKDLFNKSMAKKRGIAILMVMVSLALLMTIVTELSTKEMVRYQQAINERDALQAEALAQSGAGFAQLMLTVQEPLQKFMANFASMGVQMPSYAVWELVPIDSELLKSLSDGTFVVPEIGASKESGEKKQEQAKEEDPSKAKGVNLFGPYEAPEGGYGAFRGTFSTIIEDEEKKISIRKWSKHPFPKQKLIAEQIVRILTKPQNNILFDGSTGDNKNIGAWQLVGNIYDYISDQEIAVDVNAPKESWGRDGAGSKKSFYMDLEGILPKRAAADSIAELRFVPGMTDAIFQVLDENVSIYGESESINILSASDEMLKTVFYLCAKDRETGPFQQIGFDQDLLNEWNRKKTEGQVQISAEGIIKHLEENKVEVDKEECKKSAGTESKTFMVKSTASVGNVTRTLLMRLRSAGGMITLYQYQYL